MGIDRRQFLRVAGRGAIAEIFVGETSVGLHTVVDVSEGGLFVASPSPVLPVTTAVEVRIMQYAQDARWRAEVVQVVPTGNGRPSGYALKLEQANHGIVEAVAASPAPTPSTAGVPEAAEEGVPRVLVAMHGRGLRRALVESLVAFRVPAIGASPLEIDLALSRGLRVALIEIRNVEDGLFHMEVLKREAPRARPILLTRSLPGAVGRRRLQQGGADQLVLPPLDAFELLKRLFTKARGDIAGLGDKVG